MKKSILLLIVIGIAISLCGCKKAEQSESKYRIAGIVFQEDQFFRLVEFGMKDAADKHNCELMLANSSNKPDKEIQLVNTYISRGVDAIVISPVSATASKAALQRAHEKDIKVITYNTTVEGDIPSAYIESNQQGLGARSGAAAREYIEKNLGGKAKVAILAFKSQVPEQSNARSEGFKSEVLKLEGVEIIAEQDAWLAEMAVKKCGDIITANPDLDIIWAANEGGTVGAVMAVRNAGKEGKIAVFGTDTSKQLTDLLLADDGVLQAITGQKPFDIGSIAVTSAVRILKGEQVQSRVSIPGVMLSRQDPNQVIQFQRNLDELLKQN